MAQIVQKLVRALEALPEEEREARIASYLEDLRRVRRAEQEGADKKATPYASFKVLREAELPGPEDASATYEEKLYGSQDTEAASEQ
jgi:hypothetical protein